MSIFTPVHFFVGSMHDSVRKTNTTAANGKKGQVFVFFVIFKTPQMQLRDWFWGRKKTLVIGEGRGGLYKKSFFYFFIFCCSHSSTKHTNLSSLDHINTHSQPWPPKTRSCSTLPSTLPQRHRRHSPQEATRTCTTLQLSSSRYPARTTTTSSQNPRISLESLSLTSRLTRPPRRSNPSCKSKLLSSTALCQTTLLSIIL